MNNSYFHKTPNKTLHRNDMEKIFLNRLGSTDQHEVTSTISFDNSHHQTSSLKHCTSYYHFNQSISSKSNYKPPIQPFYFKMAANNFQQNFNYSNNQIYRPFVGQHSTLNHDKIVYSNSLMDQANRSISQTTNLNRYCSMFTNFSEDQFIIENILTLLKDQNGCRVLQKKLEEKNFEFMNIFFEKVETKINDIINDQFGNYLMQKFFECAFNIGNYAVINKVLEKIKSNMLNHSNDPYGSRVIQKILDILNSEKYNTNNNNLVFIGEMLKEFSRNNILSLVTDTNGNHVLQKTMVFFKKLNYNYIMDDIVKLAYEISKLKQGACILQKSFDIGSETQRVCILN